MKKIVISILSLGVLLLISFLFVQFGYGSSVKNAGSWSLKSVGNETVMSVEATAFNFSEAQTALLTQKLRKGSLPISIDVSCINDNLYFSDKIDSLWFRLSSNGIDIEIPIHNFISEISDSLFVVSGTLIYDMSEQISFKTEEQILGFIKEFSMGNFKCAIKPVYLSKLSVISTWIEL